MADIAVSATTVVNRQRMGHMNVIHADYAATTAAGSDTVQTPLSVVVFVNVEFINTSGAPLTTATIVSASPLSSGRILVQNSTHNNLSVRYQAWGR